MKRLSRYQKEYFGQDLYNHLYGVRAKDADYRKFLAEREDGHFRCHFVDCSTCKMYAGVTPKDGCREGASMLDYYFGEFGSPVKVREKERIVWK